MATTTVPRTYVVGLPVVITVGDDGTVTYEVDKSEAGAAIRESDALYSADDKENVIPDDVLEADAARVEAAVEDEEKRSADA